ncbi:MAG: FixH family protein [Saprospiraceae bacterium]|nr:FixH family protein [Saprospiraceae bacterium]
MKINWGWGIAIFYSVFVLSFIVILFYAFGQDNSLVTENYYDTDLAYQDHKDKMANYTALTDKVMESYHGDTRTYNIQFPAGMSSISGEVHFYRPSTASLDQRVPIQTDASNQQVIPVEQLMSGQWMVQIEWTSEGRPYFKETRLVIP